MQSRITVVHQCLLSAMIFAFCFIAAADCGRLQPLSAHCCIANACAPRDSGTLCCGKPRSARIIPTRPRASRVVLLSSIAVHRGGVGGEFNDGDDLYGGDVTWRPASQSRPRLVASSSRRHPGSDRRLAMYGRLTALPGKAEPLQRAQLMAVLSVGASALL